MPKKDLTAAIPPEQLEEMRALVAKMQIEGKDYKQKKEKEVHEREAKAQREWQARQKSNIEAADGQSINKGKADYLFIDDTKEPSDVYWVALPNPPTWRVIKTCQEFKEYLAEHGVPKFVAFDYDLGMASKGNGVDCAKYLIEFCKKEKKPMPDWIGHSAIQTGRQVVEEVLLTYRPPAP